MLRLADGGPDTVENAVALCPNCHRRLHYSGEALKYEQAIRKKVKRLALFDPVIPLSKLA